MKTYLANILANQYSEDKTYKIMKYHKNGKIHWRGALMNSLFMPGVNAESQMLKPTGSTALLASSEFL